MECEGEKGRAVGVGEGENEETRRKMVRFFVSWVSRATLVRRAGNNGWVAEKSFKSLDIPITDYGGHALY